jgi:hypothetical protein
VTTAPPLTGDPRRGSRLRRMTLLTPRNAVLLGALGLLLEVLAIIPPIDDATATNPTLHYTQHGVLFLGGLMMGVALRDLLVAGRR